MRIIFLAFFKPYSFEISKVGCDSTIAFRLKILYFSSSTNEYGQRRGLNPADRKKRMIPERKGTACVHADKPVGFGTAFCRPVKSVIGRPGLDFPESFLDCLIRHGVNPETVERLLAAGFFIDIAKNQFSLASGIGCADQAVGCWRIHELFDNFILIFRGRNHFQGNGFGENGKCIVGPFFVFGIHFIRFFKGHQMTYSPGDGIPVSDQAAIATLRALKHAGNITAYAGLFG